MAVGTVNWSSIVDGGDGASNRQGVRPVRCRGGGAGAVVVVVGADAAGGAQGGGCVGAWVDEMGRERAR